MTLDANMHTGNNKSSKFKQCNQDSSAVYFFHGRLRKNVS